MTLNKTISSLALLFSILTVILIFEFLFYDIIIGVIGFLFVLVLYIYDYRSGNRISVKSYFLAFLTTGVITFFLAACASVFWVLNYLGSVMLSSPVGIILMAAVAVHPFTLFVIASVPLQLYLIFLLSKKFDQKIKITG